MSFGRTTKANDSYLLLKQEQFLVVNSKESNDSQWNMRFDLGGKRFFGNLLAIDYNESYRTPKDRSKDNVFNRFFDNDLSIFKYLKLSTTEIKESNYVIEKELLPLLNKEEFDKRFPTSFEAGYLNAGLTKVRIEYNKKFLPVKVYGYYDGTKKVEQGWHLLRTISYPYKNKQAFDKELKEYIQLIKEVEEEKEAERRNES